MNRTQFISMTLIGFGVVIIPLICTVFSQNQKIILNVTNSMPLGFYYIHKNDSYKYGDILCFTIPENIREMVIKRKWMKKDAYFLKYLCGMPGDELFADKKRFILNGITGVIKEKDRMGLELPQLSYYGPIPKRHFFVCTSITDSFDSRYFGPIREDTIVGRATPIWTFSKKVGGSIQ